MTNKPTKICKRDPTSALQRKLNIILLTLKKSDAFRTLNVTSDCSAQYRNHRNFTDYETAQTDTAHSLVQWVPYVYQLS